MTRRPWYVFDPALAAILCIIVAGVALAVDLRTPNKNGIKMPFLSGQSCGPKCGTERWAVKTLTDQDTGGIVPQVVGTTVLALRQLRAPPRDSLPPAGREHVDMTERTLFLVHVDVLGWKAEADSDFHLVIADPAHHAQTMIAEAPNPHCAQACSSPHAGEFATVRAVVVAALGHPGRYKRLAHPVRAALTGVGFFDFIHGQTGVAPNGIELHPLLHFERE